MRKALTYKYIVITVILFFSYELTKGQCLEPIKKYVNDAVRSTEPKEGQIYLMQFSIKSIPANKSSSEISEVNSKMYRSKDQLVYKTKDVVIYQDMLNAFMIIHPNNRIIWSKNPEKNQAHSTAQIANLQKILLEESTLIHCSKSVAENKHEIIDIKLKTSKKISEEFKVTYSLMKFDVTTNQLLKVETIFDQDQPLARQIIEYQIIDYNYKGKKLKPAKSMVFNSDGKIRAEFQHYTIIEN